MSAPLSAPRGGIALLYLLPLGFFALVTWGLALLSLDRCDGAFAYALDDAYIHLSLAREIGLNGHYGINADEISAPSSSILWPFLLAPFASSPHFVLVPLILAIAAGALFILVAQNILHRAFAPKSFGAACGIAVVGCAWTLCLNLSGLCFSGMEHTLQLLLGALIVAGLQREVNGGRSRIALSLGVVLGPAARYELLGAALLACGLLALLGRRLRAVILATSALAVVAAFSFFLHSHGLGLLPTSVEAKLSSFDGGALSGIRRNLRLVLELKEAGVLAVLGGLLAAGACLFQSPRSRIALLGAGSVFGHLLFGRYGWFDRYEQYIVALALLTLAASFGPALSPTVNRVGGTRFAMAMTLLLALTFPGYAIRLLDVPEATGNVHAQQIQLGRLVGEHYRDRVAVNDLGAIAFFGKSPVLDLFGLSSRKALKHRQEARSGWIAEEVGQAKARFALVYDEFFPEQIPSEWIRVGILKLRMRRVSAAYPSVSLYAVDAEAVPKIRQALREFSSGLPASAELVLLP